jgi:hypothetical protein
VPAAYAHEEEEIDEQVYSAQTVVPEEVVPMNTPTRRPTEGVPAAGVSFAALWAAPDRSLVAEIEAAITGGRYAHATLECNALVERLLANAADLLSSAHTPRDPAVVPLLLGLDARRYLGFRSTVLRARAGEDISVREALAAFAFAIDARLAESSI